MYELKVSRRFSAAHRLPGYNGKCSNIHGHTWTVEINIRGPSLDNLGMLVDFGELKESASQVIKKLDHSYLNDLDHFDGSEPLKMPTAENIARYIFLQLKKEFQKKCSGITPGQVTVWESPDSSATYWEDG